MLSVSVALLAALALAAGVTGCAARDETVVVGPVGQMHQGDVAPDFVARDLEGDTLRLSAYRGRVVVLDFWSTFCDPCKEEFPHLESLYRANRDRGLTVIAVAMDDSDSKQDVAALTRHFALEFPVVHDEDARLAQVYDPARKAPFVVVVGRDGEVSAIRAGYSPGDEDALAEEVGAALQRGNAAALPPSTVTTQPVVARAVAR